jgi:hypothetical protein
MSEQVFRAIDDRLSTPTPVRAEFSAYVNGSRPAIRLVVDDPNGSMEPMGVYDGEPWLTATVNVPQHDVPEGAIAVKNWGENEGVERVLRAAGLIEGEAIAGLPQGHVNIPVYRLTESARLAASAELDRSMARQSQSLLRPR